MHYQRATVAITDRPEDDDIIDHTAISEALAGWPRHAARLRRGELVEAVRVGVSRGMGSSQLADLLLLHEREIDRIRAHIRAEQAGQREAVAA